MNWRINFRMRKETPELQIEKRREKQAGTWRFDLCISKVLDPGNHHSRFLDMGAVSDTVGAHAA